MDEKNIKNLIKKTGGIPSLPEIIQKVNRTVSDDNATADQLGKIIEKDQALTSKVLRLANSSYYGLSRHVDSISRAITILGFNSVSSMALAVSVGGMFAGKGREGSIALTDLWEHSLACGIGAKAVMDNVQNSSTDKAFLGGILHDVGKVLINMKFQQEQKAVISSVCGGGIKLLDAERQILGFTHAEIGAIMGELWNFPKDIVETVRYHHRPLSARISRDTVCAVHMGNEIVKAMGLGKSTEPHVLPVMEEEWKCLEIKQAELPKIISAIHDEFNRAEEFMSL